MSKKKHEDEPLVVAEIDGEATPREQRGEAGEKQAAADAKRAEADAGQETYTLTAEEFEEARAHIAKLQQEKDETVNLLQRNQADFENYRRRNNSIRVDSYEEGKRDCIKQLLPALDNFDRALDNEGADNESWREGVRLACRQLHELLEKQGLQVIDASGKFDPNEHEAVMQEKEDGKETGDILMVLQKGYRVGDKIIRHSMVKVAE